MTRRAIPLFLLAGFVCLPTFATRPAAANCNIDGPDRVTAGQSFELCARETKHAAYSWSGPGITSSKTARCIQVSGLPAGTYLFKLAISDSRRHDAHEINGRKVRLCGHCVVVTGGGGSGGDSIACGITGPSSVLLGTPIVLCGPNDNTAGWSWSGPGVPASSNSRCVTITGLGVGSYTFVLRRSNGTREVFCKQAVTVLQPGGGDGGSNDLCPGPIRFWLEQCRQSGGGPIGIGAQTLLRIGRCVDDRTTAFNWGGDPGSFCALIESSSLRARDLLRQQLAILLANRCARDFDVRLPNGDRIGIDSTARFACSPLDTGRVDVLVTRAESLLVQCGNPRTAPADCQANLTALMLCIARLNRGPDTCSVGPSGAASLAVEFAGSEAAMSPPIPNPFTTSTGMSYALPQASQVQIGVYDLSGRRVRLIESGRKAPGLHEMRWDGSDESGARVRPGVYFLRGTIGARSLGVRVVYLH